MARYKVLRSVAHNLGHSFLSDMNTARSRQSNWFIVPEHIFELARRNGAPKIEIDFLAESIHPEVFATREVRESVTNYHKQLPRLVESQGGAWASVEGVTLELRFELGTRREDEARPGRELPVFECRTEILDDRGVVHTGRPTNWWTG